MADATTVHWDLFICHASEDKDGFVRPLAEALTKFGVLVWYDDFTLKVGDSITRSIDHGLALSSFGAVVLSPAFFKKAWPEYELRGLTAKEVGSGKVILPIWLGVTRDDVLRYSPPLADKRALNTEGKSVTEVAVSLIEEVRPDIFENVHRRLAYRLQLEQSRVERVDPKTLRLGGTIRHETLPSELIGRIRLVRAALLGFYPHSMDFWLAGFQRDAHPSTEVAYWEHLASVLLEYSAMTRLTGDQRGKVLSLASGISNEAPEEKLKDLAASLPDGALETLRTLWRGALPAFDFEDDASIFEATTEDPPIETDIELFPSDLPKDLIEDLLARRRKSGDV